MGSQSRFIERVAFVQLACAQQAAQHYQSSNHSSWKGRFTTIGLTRKSVDADATHWMTVTQRIATDLLEHLVITNELDFASRKVFDEQLRVTVKQAAASRGKLVALATP